MPGISRQPPPWFMRPGFAPKEPGFFLQVSALSLSSCRCWSYRACSARVCEDPGKSHPGLAIALGRVYPRWVGLMAAISGAAFMYDGAVVGGLGGGAVLWAGGACLGACLWAGRGAGLGAAQWWVVRVAAEGRSPPPRSGCQPPFTPVRLSGMGDRQTDLSPGGRRSPLSPQPHPAAPSEHLRLGVS
jgi:hypothetical protein